MLVCRGFSDRKATDFSDSQVVIFSSLQKKLTSTVAGFPEPSAPVY
jgi:hypothetical protein